MPSDAQMARCRSERPRPSERKFCTRSYGTLHTWHRQLHGKGRSRGLTNLPRLESALSNYERLGGDQNQKIQGAIERGWPLVASSFSPEMRDFGHKTILGKTAAYDAETFLRVLAYHPITAKRMVAKLFTFFAYDKPAPE